MGGGPWAVDYDELTGVVLGHARGEEDLWVYAPVEAVAPRRQIQAYDAVEGNENLGAEGHAPELALIRRQGRKGHTQ